MKSLAVRTRSYATSTLPPPPARSGASWALRTAATSVSATLASAEPMARAIWSASVRRHRLLEQREHARAPRRRVHCTVARPARDRRTRARRQIRRAAARSVPARAAASSRVIRSAPPVDDPHRGDRVQPAFGDRLPDLRDRHAVVERELEQLEAFRRVGRRRVVDAELLELLGRSRGHLAPGEQRVAARGRLVDQLGSRPGARSVVPAGTSHSSAGRGPCQRTANDTGPRRVGASCTSRSCPSQDRG